MGSVVILLVILLVILFLGAVAGWAFTHGRLGAARRAIDLEAEACDQAQDRWRHHKASADVWHGRYVRAAREADQWFEAWGETLLRAEAAEAKVDRMTTRARSMRGRFARAA